MSGVNQPWPVNITERSSRLTFSYRPWPAHNTQSISDMVYPHCPCHAHFSTDACHGLPTSPVSYAHHLSIVKHGMHLSSVAYTHLQMEGRISQDMHVSSVQCVNRLGDIGHGMHALARWHRPMTRCINKGLHTSDMVYAHLEITSDCDIQHNLRHENITCGVCA